MKNLTDLEKVVLKAIVESAHESGDNGVEFLLDEVVSETRMSWRSVQGVCSSLQRKGYIECFSGEYYFDGMIHDNAEEWYKETFTQKSLVLSTPDQHHQNNNESNNQKCSTEKFALELELRHREVKNGEVYYRTPKIVIGIYDSWDEAGKEGNTVIQNCLANYFLITDKFGENYTNGMPNNFICNLGDYGRLPMSLAIRKLKTTTDVETFVTDAIAKHEEYKEWEKSKRRSMKCESK